MIKITDFWKKIKHFKKSEFSCKCRCGFNIIDKDLVKKLDMARTLSNVPFNINSACRCKKHNLNIKGSKTSSHLSGFAVDIEIVSSIHRHKILVALLGVGFTRIGIYKDFIHVDCDLYKEQNVIWYK